MCVILILKAVMNARGSLNLEECRLETFQDWPQNAAVEPSRIAAAGFYSTGTDLHVRCFSCGCEIVEWEYGDQVMARHRAINPDCEFVRDPQRAGNVPLQQQQHSLLQPSQRNGRENMPQRLQEPTVGRWVTTTTVYKSEQARLDSFVDWPIPFIVRPEALAATGFYFLRQGDKVQCAFCTGIISRWEPGDIPKEEHRRHFPSCPFVLDLPVGNIPRVANHISIDSLLEQSRLDELGIQAHRGPRHPKYSTVESRLSTFVDWPAEYSQRPTDLAQAGLFHMKTSESGPAFDLVRCFHCDGGLRNWEPDDIPWREHARWFPKCPFLILVKGKRFIDVVQAHYRGAAGDVNERPEPADGEAGISEGEQRSSPRRPSGLSTSLPALSRTEVDDNSDTSEGAVGGSSLEEENRRLKDARQCKICMDAEIGTVLLPCGHLVACVRCAPSLLDCPVCRVTIKATVRTFLS